MTPSPRVRNFSPWAYWSLHLRSVVDDDPLPASDADISAWRDRVRARLIDALGPTPPPVPLDVEIDPGLDCGDHVRHRVVFDTEASMSVPAYLLVPTSRLDTGVAGSAVLAVHGHGPGKDMICGLVGPEHEHYALELVRLGHVVLAPDLRCFGERQDPQWDPDGHKYDCDWNLVAATMAGVSPLAQNLWDLQCALGVLVEHSLVDAQNIAVAGLSYGATMSLFLAALDERVRLAVVSGYLSSWRAAHALPWNMCGSQVVPGQLGRFEHVDIASLIAPRPLLVESGTQDPLFPVDAAVATVTGLRRVYAAIGADPAAVVHDVFDGDHRWNGTHVGNFLEVRREGS